VSPALLSCTPQPESPPHDAGATQRDVALYIVDLAAAGDYCRSKLGSVRRITQILVIAVPIVSTMGAIVLGFLFNKWERATVTEVKELITEAVADTNKRISDLAAGVSSQKTELHEFHAYADKHHVEVTDLAEVKASFQASMSTLRDYVRTATATMGDVRDAVIAITTTGGKPAVPPARRRATKTA